MNRFLIFVLLFLITFSSSCSQSSSVELSGSWIYTGLSKSNKEAIECPDVLHFNKDGSYTILNDCYGVGLKLPVVEQGRWFYEPVEKKVTLNGRKFFTNYFFLKKSSTLSFSVLERSKETLRICFSRDLSQVEVYKRLSDSN